MTVTVVSSMLSAGRRRFKLVHERQDRVRLAHACRMKPEQRAFRAGHARNAQALGQAFRNFFAPRRALAQDGHGGGTRRQVAPR